MNPVDDAAEYISLRADGSLVVDSRWEGYMATAHEDGKLFLACVEDNIVEVNGVERIRWSGVYANYAESKKMRGDKL